MATTKKKRTSVSVDTIITRKIHFLRGEKVMLDRDLASLYGVETRVLKQSANRNKERFPKSFMFSLTKKEVAHLVEKEAIPSLQSLGGSTPLVFTEHGILMLANVLKSDSALQMSVRIIEVFVNMRHLLLAHKDIVIQLEKMDKAVKSNTTDIQAIFNYLKQLLAEEAEPRTQIGYISKQRKKIKVNNTNGFDRYHKL